VTRSAARFVALVGLARARAAARGAYAGANLAWSVFRPPRETLEKTPGELGLTFEDWQWRTTRDRLTVHGWFVPGTGPAAVVVSHGMGRSRQSALPQIALLHELGCHVLAYDLRNHGTTTASRRFTGMAARFTSDLIDATARLRRDHRVVGPVGVMAMSFSTWPAIAAGRGWSAGIDAIVCDSGPVVDIGAAFARYALIKANLAGRPDTEFSRPAFVRTSRIVGAWILGAKGWPPSRVDVPTLLIASGRDRLLPADEVEELADLVEGAECWTVARALHLHGLRSDPAGYRDEVARFFGRHLKVDVGVR
jgi:alpha-beta hydrolase superfamily lysophospholipase